jgi:hypothetical protein
MTDPHHNHGHDSHGAHGGGHEIDAPPTRELFNIVWGLGLLTLLSLVTCVQLFNNQAREIGADRGKEGSYVLADYRKDAETRTRGSGQDSVTDATGKVVAKYNYIPLASARELILGKPEKLGAFAPPPGWIHPDDVAAGGQGGQPAAPQPIPADGQPTPGTEGQPAGAAGTAGSPLPTEAPGTLPGPKDEAMPINADKGQSESTKPVPGGTPEPVGAKTPGTPAGAPADVDAPPAGNRPGTEPGHGAPTPTEPTPTGKATPEPVKAEPAK